MPDAALRETILNALVHRDYAIGAPVQIRVYEDRMKIWNPAVRPEGWTLENLLADHASTPFNPDVANAFFRAGEIETWGRGIQRIFEACLNAGAPAPIIDYKPNDLWIEFPFAPEYLKALGQKAGAALVSKLDEKVGERRATILRLIHANPKITVTDIAASLAISRTAVDNQIQILKKDGWLLRVGPARGGHWNVSNNPGL